MWATLRILAIPRGIATVVHQRQGQVGVATVVDVGQLQVGLEDGGFEGHACFLFDSCLRLMDRASRRKFLKFALHLRARPAALPNPHGMGVRKDDGGPNRHGFRGRDRQ